MKNLRKKKSRFFVGLLTLAVFLCFLGTPQQALAYAPVDTEREVSLTLKADAPEAVFLLYRVAEVSESAEYTPVDEFAEYPLDFTQTESSGWRALALTLDGYVQRDEIAPLRMEKTGEDGKVQFSKLQTGLYLVRGESYRKGTKLCTPVSFLINLPQSLEDDSWDYAPSVTPKTEDETVATQLSVRKIWKDSGHEKHRPDSVTVQLLENGKVLQEVKLHEKNGWQYTWKELDSSSKWTVTEKGKPEHYTVLVGREGSTFLVTNTYRGGTSSGSDSGTGSTGEKLPQTGQLWWPVAVLGLTGLVQMIYGVATLRKDETDEPSKR